MSVFCTNKRNGDLCGSMLKVNDSGKKRCVSCDPTPEEARARAITQRKHAEEKKQLENARKKKGESGPSDESLGRAAESTKEYYNPNNISDGFPEKPEPMKEKLADTYAHLPVNEQIVELLRHFLDGLEEKGFTISTSLHNLIVETALDAYKSHYILKNHQTAINLVGIMHYIADLQDTDIPKWALSQVSGVPERIITRRVTQLKKLLGLHKVGLDEYIAEAEEIHKKGDAESHNAYKCTIDMNSNALRLRDILSLLPGKVRFSDAAVIYARASGEVLLYLGNINVSSTTNGLRWIEIDNNNDSCRFSRGESPRITLTGKNETWPISDSDSGRSSLLYNTEIQKHLKPDLEYMLVQSKFSTSVIPGLVAKALKGLGYKLANE